MKRLCSNNNLPSLHYGPKRRVVVINSGKLAQEFSFPFDKRKTKIYVAIFLNC